MRDPRITLGARGRQVQKAGHKRRALERSLRITRLYERILYECEMYWQPLLIEAAENRALKVEIVTPFLAGDRAAKRAIAEILGDLAVHFVQPDMPLENPRRLRMVVSWK